MMWQAFVAEFRREWITLRRYPTEFFGELVVVVVIFYGLFLGSSYMSGGGIFGARLSSVILGYTLWTLSLAAIGNMGYSISNEAQNGTLEQVFLSPVGAVRILILRNIASLIFSMLFTVLVIYGIMALTGHFLPLSPIDLVPLVMAVGTAMGIGFLIASITILFKRTNQLLGLLQFVLLFIIMTPFTTFHGAWQYLGVIAPLSPMVGLLQSMLVDHQGLLTAPGHWFWWGFVNVALWLGLGIAVFSRAYARAKTRGTLGHY